MPYDKGTKSKSVIKGKYKANRGAGKTHNEAMNLAVNDNAQKNTQTKMKPIAHKA